MDQPTAPQDIFARHVTRRMWRETLFLGLLLYIAFVILTYVLDGALGLRTYSKALGGTAAILFGASFAMSGFCYYFDFLDAKIGYRKYLGLTGYFFALLYSFSLLIVEPERYFYGFFNNFWSADFLLGLTSMALFTFMALISNTSAMKKLGPHRWRLSLRVGYFAWSLLALRAFAIEHALWAQWLRTFKGFPPPRMLLSLYVVSIILFRVSIELSKYFKRGRTTQPITTTTNPSNPPPP